jgi:hypothetical protein
MAIAVIVAIVAIAARLTPWLVTMLILVLGERGGRDGGEPRGDQRTAAHANHSGVPLG